MKQVIVMRKDLNMRKGKMCAQAAHASMKQLLEYQNAENESVSLENVNRMEEWLSSKFTKICVSVDSDTELLSIINKATEAGIMVSSVIDSGLTEFGGVRTLTCCAIGPAEPSVIDEITGHLSLL